VLETAAEAIGAAREALTDLETLGETVTDDWQYVADLGRAWRAKLDAVPGHTPLTRVQYEALERAVLEVRAITDPHRAIDWLSTFPQLVLSILGPG
jgi:hypothetical protein